MKNAFLTDKDVMTLLRISARTLRYIMRHGPCAKCALDLRKIGPIRVGSGRLSCQRRWSVGKFAELTGISREDIWATLA